MAPWFRSYWRKTARNLRALHTQLAWHTSILRSRAPRIRQQWIGERTFEGVSNVAVLIHFDRSGRFLSYFHFMLRALDRAGYTVIIVSNSRKLLADEVASLLPYCARVIHRDNTGYDFGAWRDGLSVLPPDLKLQRLILANDSVFGPLQDLATVIAKCDPQIADVWGITDCYQFRYHLQSYFLLFHERALQSKAFAKFWKSFRYTSNKSVVIGMYEVGMSQALLKGGLRLRALCPYPQLVDEVVLGKLDAAPEDEYFERLLDGVNAGVPLNPSHFFWEHLVTVARCPFIKRDLLESNPVGIPLVANWRRAITSASDYPIHLIDEYMQVATRDRVF
jgi:lipopolysaccharide biosynthesis protein